MKTKPVFNTIAQHFGYCKMGAQHRFAREHEELSNEILTARIADSLAIEVELRETSKWNSALAKTKARRVELLADEQVKQLLNTVYQRFRAEIERLVTKFGGHPQEDGMVLFPDGSTAKMPKGLYISPEKQILRASA